MGNEATLVSDQRQASAAEVALVYANDGEAGIRRRRAGKGFRYLWPDGERVRDPAVLDRIRALVVPPAWTDVWIAPSADCHLQVTGKDARGRKQYRYHERWTACRDEVKYANLIEFARALPRLRRTIDADLGRRGLGREKVLATVVRLLDTTMIRVGNAAYARDNGSFGLTTFRDRHVRDRGLDLAVPLQGQVGQGVAVEGDGSPRRPDRQGNAGPAGPAALPVPRRRRREAPRHLERRERLHSRGRRRPVLVEALPHLGRHGSGARCCSPPSSRRVPAGPRRSPRTRSSTPSPAASATPAPCVASAISIPGSSRTGRRAGSRKRSPPSAGGTGRAPGGLDRSEQLALRWLETAEAGERPARRRLTHCGVHA